MINEIKEMIEDGATLQKAADKLGITKSKVNRLCKANGIKLINYKDINIEFAKMYNNLDYSLQQIAEHFGYKMSSLYVKANKMGLKRANIKVEKRLKKEIVPAEISRDLLGKGFAKGADNSVTLNPKRDDGRLVKFKYSDLSDYPTVECSIRVRDESVSNEQAVSNWCKKLGKKSWRLA